MRRPLWILLLLFRLLAGQRLTPCDDDGYIEVEENSDLTLTCAGYTGAATWGYKDPSSTSTSAIATCSNTACTVPAFSAFSLVFNNATSSTLTSTLTSRAAAEGAYTCGTAICTVAIIVAAVVDPGSIVVQKGNGEWSLAANNTISSVYSSRQQYNCVWFRDSQMDSPINTTTPSLTPLPSDSTDTSDRAGFCAASWPMPLNPGSYTYVVMVSPGNTIQSAGNISIARPDPPSLGGNCPTDFLPEFSPVTCSCVITNAGSPPADVTWSGMTSQTLTLNNVSRGDDNKRYTCILQWSSENLNATFDLRVAYGPYPGKTSISSNDVTGDVFDTDGSRNLTVSCDYPPDDVSPGLTYSWDQPEACRGQVSRTCQFVPQLGNNVSVICNVTNEKNQGRSAKANRVIPLNYPPPLSPVITGYTTGDVLYANDSLTLTCDVTGGDPDVINVTLKCDNHPQSVTAGNRGSLTVTSLGADDHMTSCVCSAAWKVTSLYTKTSDVTLTVHSPPSPPSITSNDSTQFPYMEGDTPTLTCSSVSQGVPPATFLWSGVTEQDTVVTSPGNSRLQMAPLIRDDNRRDVTCTAVNDFTQHRNNVTAGNFTIAVYYSPVVDIQPLGDNQCTPYNETDIDIATCVVPEGQRVNVTCAVTSDGNPPVTDFKWTSSACYVSGVNSSVLTITSAQRQRDDCGFTCTATTGSSVFDSRLPLSANTSLQVFVAYPATVTIFTLNDANDTMTLNESDPTPVRLFCQSDGRPTPDVRLFRVADSVELSSVTGGSYGAADDVTSVVDHVIPVAGCEDTGTYTCESDNHLGQKSSQSVSLYVKCKPKELSPSPSPTTTRLNFITIPVTLTFRLAGYPPPSPLPLHYAGTLSNSTGAAVVSTRLYTAHCLQDVTRLYITDCRVTLANVTLGDKGFYDVTFGNDVGRVTFRFELDVNGTASPQGGEQSSGPPLAAAVGGGVAAFTLVIAAVVIGVVIRRRRADHKKPDDPRDRLRNARSPNQDNDSEMITNSAYASAENPDGEMITNVVYGTAPPSARERQGTGRDQPAGARESDGVYAVVDKSSKDTERPQEGGACEAGDVYANVDKSRKNAPPSPPEKTVYANAAFDDNNEGDSNGTRTDPDHVNADGCHYVALEFSQNQREKEKLDPPERESTLYADIDMHRKPT